MSDVIDVMDPEQVARLERFIAEGRSFRIVNTSGETVSCYWPDPLSGGWAYTITGEDRDRRLNVCHPRSLHVEVHETYAELVPWFEDGIGASRILHSGWGVVEE